MGKKGERSRAEQKSRKDAYTSVSAEDPSLWPVGVENPSVDDSGTFLTTKVTKMVPKPWFHIKLKDRKGTTHM